MSCSCSRGFPLIVALGIRQPVKLSAVKAKMAQFRTVPSLRCRTFNARSYCLRFGIRARNRPSCRDDAGGLGSPQLQVFQEPSRIADELVVGACRESKGDGDVPYECHAIF